MFGCVSCLHKGSRIIFGGSRFVTQRLSLILLISELILLMFIDVMDVLGLNSVVIFGGWPDELFGLPSMMMRTLLAVLLLFPHDVHSGLWFMWIRLVFREVRGLVPVVLFVLMPSSTESDLLL